MSLSDSQQNANRENATHSTGPKTEEGKARSRLNAFRHGITAKLLVMTEEESIAYQKFSRDLFFDLQPVGAMENLLVQTVVDSNWRMNCARTHEMALFAINHDESDQTSDHPEIDAALTAADVLSKKTNELKLVSLYESRINRTSQTAMKQLRERQAERQARESKEMAEASDIQKMFEMLGKAYKPQDSGFVFSLDRLNQYNVRQTHLLHAKIAKEVGYQIEIFRQKLERA